MRALLSTIGSRGDVQPLVALAVQLKALGHEVRLCVPPDFVEWIESLGIAVVPIGPDVRKFAAAKPMAAQSQMRPTAEQRQQMADATVVTQFETITAAAEGCDIIVAATALQIAARSIAEKKGIPYVFAAYTPTVLPSPHHPPPALPPLPGQAPLATNDNRALWAADTARFNDLFRSALNAHRMTLGLPMVTDVRAHMFTDRPWLAADPTLGPWPGSSDEGVFQTGAWILPDERPLAGELQTFLAAGAPPIYFGFGSTAATPAAGQAMLRAARALGCRAIVSRGWFDADLIESEPDCISIGDANLHALFPRAAAVVHHGGAGTTTAAALAGAPQVVVSHHYDQHYWAKRVQQLGLGVAHAADVPTTESLIAALTRVLQPDVAARARSVSREMCGDGVQIAAQRLISCVHDRTR